MARLLQLSILGGLSGMALNIGCGPAIPLLDVPKTTSPIEVKPREVQQLRAWEIPGQFLRPRLVSASGGGHSSASQGSLYPSSCSCEGRGVENPVRSNPNQIFLTRMIHLDQAEMCLVWADEALEIPILSTSATHQVLSANNQILGSEQAVSVFHNPQLHFWFVRLEDLFQEQNPSTRNEVSEADTQILLLQFMLANNTLTSVEVQFRASNPRR